MHHVTTRRDATHEPYTPGCDRRCTYRHVIEAGLVRSTLLLHDPSAHEQYGRGLGVEPVRFIATGLLEIDLDGLLVCVAGERIDLTATETRLIGYLGQRLGQLCRIEDIVRDGWSESYQLYRGANMLRTNIARLRGKLGPAGGTISTQIGLGYRLEDLPLGQAQPSPSKRYLPAGGWSKLYPACRRCGRTDKSHRGHGYCTRWACSHRADRGAEPSSIADERTS